MRKQLIILNSKFRLLYLMFALFIQQIYFKSAPLGRNTHIDVIIIKYSLILFTVLVADLTRMRSSIWFQVIQTYLKKAITLLVLI